MTEEEKIHDALWEIGGEIVEMETDLETLRQEEARLKEELKRLQKPEVEGG